MKSLSMLDWVSFVLVIVGGLNWGLVGLLNFDLVAMIFGSMTVTSRTIYTLVGIAAIYLSMTVMSMGKKE